MWAPEEGAIKTPLLKGGNVNSKFTSDPSWRGVQQERVFRDVIFAVLFLLCFGAMIGIGILGFTKGDPSFLPNMSAETVIAEHVDSYMTTAVAQLKEGQMLLTRQTKIISSLLCLEPLSLRDYGFRA